MEQKFGNRYKPLQRPRLRDYFDSVLFGGFFTWRLPHLIKACKKVCQSPDTFFRFLRETEKLTWVKLTHPTGIYYVKEIAPRQFEITCTEITFTDTNQKH